MRCYLSHQHELHVWCICMTSFCFCGAGDKSGGCVRGLYDPTLSERGVLLCAARKPRAKDPLDFEVTKYSMCPQQRAV